VGEALDEAAGCVLGLIHGNDRPWHFVTLSRRIVVGTDFLFRLECLVDFFVLKTEKVHVKTEKVS